jgi:hypothetical protein
MEILMNAMNHTHSEINCSDQSLLAARIILRDVYRIVSGIQCVAAFVLCYAALGAAVADGLVNAAYPAVDENQSIDWSGEAHA